jgi:3-phenylpropionate/cinnamic acid dioxygenase small subunit
MLTRAQAEEFLFYEAELLDERRYNAWLDLFAPRGIYWLPIDPDAPPDSATSLIFDEPVRRRERVWRLLHTPVQGQIPASRTCHSISNVRIESVGNEAKVLSSQIIHELRPGELNSPAPDTEPRAWVGRCEHRLELNDGRVQIALKKLVLLNRDRWIGNLTFLL